MTITTSTSDTETTATNGYWQHTFTVKQFTLSELAAMPTSLSNPQVPVDEKKQKKLGDSLRKNGQVNPFKVTVYDGVHYLTGGRNRLNAQLEENKLPPSAPATCLLYEVSTAEALSMHIIADNETRTARAPEKDVLLLSGKLSLRIGTDSLEEYYDQALEEGLSTELKKAFFVETAEKLSTDSRLSGDKVTEDCFPLTQTTIKKVLVSTWREVLAKQGYAAYRNQILASGKNMYLFQQAWIDTIATACLATRKKYSYVSNWARDGVSYLSTESAAATRLLLPTLTFPDDPKVIKELTGIPPKSTQSKAKTSTRVSSSKK